MMYQVAVSNGLQSQDCIVDYDTYPKPNST